jgi:hypothetical protein
MRVLILGSGTGLSGSNDGYGVVYRLTYLADSCGVVEIARERVISSVEQDRELTQAHPRRHRRLRLEPRLGQIFFLTVRAGCHSEEEEKQQVT